MTQISMLVSAGDGPVECNQAVGHVLHQMQVEASQFGLDLHIHETMGQHGPKSAVVVTHGIAARAFVATWLGTIQWRMQSQIRRNHKRSNWFIGVFELAGEGRANVQIRQCDIAFSTLRAGGPGGQHQNTTDSAVRAVHTPTGLTVVVREARSQHRNKALAIERLQGLADAHDLAERAAQRDAKNRLHRQLERGNPTRRFVGEGFVEDLRLK